MTHDQRNERKENDGDAIDVRVWVSACRQMVKDGSIEHSYDYRPKQIHKKRETSILN